MTAEVIEKKERGRPSGTRIGPYRMCAVHDQNRADLNRLRRMMRLLTKILEEELKPPPKGKGVVEKMGLSDPVRHERFFGKSYLATLATLIDLALRLDTKKASVDERIAETQELVPDIKLIEAYLVRAKAPISTTYSEVSE